MAIRRLWLWLDEGANEIEQKYWAQFVKMNLALSTDVRFLVAKNEHDYTFKKNILEKAGWSLTRSGGGKMTRIRYFTKEHIDT